MKINRREFIGRSAIGVGGIMLGSQLAALAKATDSTAGAVVVPNTFDPYQMVTLGKTSLKVSRVCMGTGMNGGSRQSNQTRLGRERFQGLLASAYERGVRMFDLADSYGTHPYLMPALKGVPREKFTIVTKIWWGDGGLPEEERPDADIVVARFLKEIGTDYLDLVLLHCVTSPKWPEELRRQMDILSKLKEQGKIRALGVSCHSLGALEAAAAEPWVESVHARINHTGASMDGRPDVVVPVLRKIHAAGKGVVGMKLIGAGQYRNDDAMRNRSVKFVLGLGCVDVLNVGFESLTEIDDFAGRVRNVALPAKVA